MALAAIWIVRSNSLPVLRQVLQRREDVGHLGAGGVVGLDVDEAHGAILIDDEHGGSGQADCALGVDLGQVETELALGGEDIVGLLERDADPIGQTTARIGEDGELQGGLFHAWRATRRVTAG